MCVCVPRCVCARASRSAGACNSFVTALVYLGVNMCVYKTLYTCVCLNVTFNVCIARRQGLRVIFLARTLLFWPAQSWPFFFGVLRSSSAPWPTTLFTSVVFSASSPSELLGELILAKTPLLVPQAAGPRHLSSTTRQVNFINAKKIIFFRFFSGWSLHRSEKGLSQLKEHVTPAPSNPADFWGKHGMIQWSIGLSILALCLPMSPSFPLSSYMSCCLNVTFNVCIVHCIHDIIITCICIMCAES